MVRTPKCGHLVKDNDDGDDNDNDNGNDNNNDNESDEIDSFFLWKLCRSHAYMFKLSTQCTRFACPCVQRVV